MEKYTVEQLQEIVEQVGYVPDEDELENFEFLEMELIGEEFNGMDMLDVLRMTHNGNFNVNDKYFMLSETDKIDSFSQHQVEEILKNNYDKIVQLYNKLVKNRDMFPID